MKNKTNRRRFPEQGQTIVIIALSFVVLLGFAGLALDGGMLYSDRRHAQNAADTSSLAGATAAATYLKNNAINKNSFHCGSTYVLNAQQVAEDAAISRASTNDYNLDKDISDHHGVTATCGVEDQGYRLVKYIDITTQITRETSTNFAHLVYPGPLINEVEAVARVYPPGPLAEGYSIVSLNGADCSGNQNGLILGGSMNGKVTGSAGIFTNGCIKGDGSNFGFEVTNEGVVGYAGRATGTLNSITPPPEYFPNKLDAFTTNVPPPDCSSLDTLKAPLAGNRTIKPGKYERIKWTNGTLTLDPGLYCITESQGFVIEGGSLSGDGVTIYLETGGMTVGGSAEGIYLRAPVASPDPSPAIPGMLIYMAGGNTSTIKLSGNSTSAYIGTVYAPSGDIQLTGTSATGGSVTFNTQLIGYNVHISGNTTIDINYIDEEQSEKPPFLDLLQ